MPREELSGWKAIASYLNVSVRTAQEYEKNLGLPVYHGPGLRGRVVAEATDLDRWSRENLKRLPVSASHQPSLDTDSGTQEAVEKSSVPSPIASRRRVQKPILYICSVFALGGVAVAFAILGSGAVSNHPVDWRVQGNTLTVVGEGGRELWHHDFAVKLDADSYAPGTKRCIFADLDGDGQMETIFHYTFVGLASDHPRIVCFNSDGKIRWEFSTSRTVFDAQARPWAPPFLPNNFSIIEPKAGPRRVVVSSNHYWSYPDQVAVLDPDGQLVNEFWHRGHLIRAAVADLDGDGYPEVLLGGVNDAPEYKRATLLVFDHRSISGASSSPSGERYFKGFAAGTQKAEIFFPRTALSKDQEFNRVSEVMVGTNRITVVVAEGVDEARSPLVVYDLDFGLNVKSVALTDIAVARYHELESKGVVPMGSFGREIDRLRRAVEVLR